MSQLDLSDLKAHLRIEHADQDDLIQSKIDAAERYIQNYLRRDLDADFPSGWPDDIKQAVCMLGGHYYRCTEAGSEQNISAVPFGVKDLLAAYRDLS